VIARRYCDKIWNARHYDAAGELFHPQFHYEEAPGRSAPAKLAAIRDFHTSFPDLHISIDDLIPAGDRVAAKLTVTGTDTGGVQGKPPTGRPVRFWAVEHLGIRDGQIISDWSEGTG
jgi:predicted ester cyclase